VSRETLAYCAGLLDGEGCITIKRTDKRTYGRRSPTYVFSVCIEMADPRPIRFFCETFGLPVNLNMSRHLKDPIKHRRLFVAQIGRVEGLELLRQLLPFLHGKREEAETAIEFYEQCFLAHNNLSVGRNRRPVPAELLKLRHRYYLKLRALKTRRFR
jgi:hypothetical protein